MDNAMSTRTIELFRQYAEKERLKQQPEHKSQTAQERSEQTEEPNLVVEMSNMEHSVRQLFEGASPTDRDNIIRYLEVLIRNLKRVRDK
jgi:hypothetical protein